MRPTFTLPVAAVHGLLAGPRARGVATVEWVRAALHPAGLDPLLLETTASRVTVEQFVRLFRTVMDLLEDECLGLLSRPLRPGSVALIARSTLGARSVDAALRRLVGAFALLQDDVTLVCVADGALSGAALEFRDARTHRPHFLHELLLRTFWRLLAWLHGGPLVPRRFDFAFARPDYASDYAAVLPGELRFTEKRSAFWFDSAALARPVRCDVLALQAFLRGLPGNLIGPHLFDHTASGRARALLRRTCPVWPDLRSAARQLHMSASSLQRHLATEGTSYQAIKDELRRDLAVARLTTSPVAFEDLAADLGFSDATAFQRAFKAWTGTAPGAYRAGRENRGG
jgi:AraC-like DNA-binding protein